MGDSGTPRDTRRSDTASERVDVRVACREGDLDGHLPTRPGQLENPSAVGAGSESAHGHIPHDRTIGRDRTIVAMLSVDERHTSTRVVA